MSSSIESMAETSVSEIFEERAENLDKVDLDRWTELTADNRSLIAKLKGPGAKLLIGPRGSGKSTLLRAAYYEMIDDKDGMPVYVNYARSIALEPLFHRKADALQIFRQWVVMKVVLGVRETLHDARIDEPESLTEICAGAESYVNGLSRGDDAPALAIPLSPNELCQRLDEWAAAFGAKRTILLFDDAAHAFSLPQQQQFFEIYRELRTRSVSPKAAVYPGITAYSPFMHVGHEAEILEAWLRPDSEDFLPTMRRIVQRRLPERVVDRLNSRDLVDYLALASFGVPRGFLVMLRDVLGVDDEATEFASTVSRRSADRAIAAHAEVVRSIFTSLAVKMPRYKRFVEIGSELERASLESLRSFNRPRTDASRAVVIALSEPIEAEVSRILDMLEYAGIFRKLDSVSRGVKGRFRRYEVHYALVMEANALALGRSPSTAAVISTLSRRDAHAFARSSLQRLIGKGYIERCKLDFEPCHHCGAARVSEDARFCMRCGERLGEASIFEELSKNEIGNLPLTQKKVDALLSNTSIRTVKDVLLDLEYTEILKAHYVGPKWATRIYQAAEEYVNV